MTAVQGPFFDDLARGDVFDTAPPAALTDGTAAVHAGIVGERLRLALDPGLSRAVLRADRPAAPPSLVWDLAIGQSTPVTHHVRANLFYRGLVLRRLPLLGDVLRTRSEVVGLKQNRSGATGLVALRITTVDQDDRTVLDFWRCAMLPLSAPDVQTGHADDLSTIGTSRGAGVEAAGVEGAGAEAAADPGALVAGWDLDAYRAGLPASLRREVAEGSVLEVVGGDVVSSAPELARLTLNVARTHSDDAAGERLVYGGHTVGLALLQATRALPELVTVAAWHGCDHTGPVREGDTLASTVTVERLEPGPGCRLAHLRSVVTARSGPGDEPRDVLDWRYVAVLP